MRQLSNPLLTAALCLTPGALAFAQEEAAPVQSLDSVEEVEDLRPIFLSGNRLPDLQHPELGRVGGLHDLALDPESGRIQRLIVDVRETPDDPMELRSLPYGEVRWDVEKQALQITIDPEELLARVAFDAASMKEGGPLALAQRSSPTEASMRKSQWHSALVGTPVHANDGPFGSIADLIIEPQTGTVAFFTLTSETQKDHPYVLPWQSLVRGEEGLHSVEKSALDLGAAPQFPPNGLEALRDEEMRVKVYSFYGTPIVRFATSPSTPG